jgi:hypothetical protein
VRDILHKLRLWLSPPIGRRRAVDIARQSVVPDARRFHVYGRKTNNVNVYNLPAEPCWFVFAPWNDGKDGQMLRSSRLLLISKMTGKVLFDGSANDEG